MGALSLPHVAGPGAGETGAAPPAALQGLGPEDGQGVQAQGPVHPIRGQAQAGQTCTDLQDATD